MHGSAHGSGVYLSPNSNVSFGYTSALPAPRKDNKVLFYYVIIIIATTVIIITKVSSPKLTWASGLFERLSNLCTAPINTFQGACYFKVGHDQDTKQLHVMPSANEMDFFPWSGAQISMDRLCGGGGGGGAWSTFYQRVYRSVIYHPSGFTCPLGSSDTTNAASPQAHNNYNDLLCCSQLKWTKIAWQGNWHWDV